jgi:hypothetical protein
MWHCPSWHLQQVNRPWRTVQKIPICSQLYIHRRQFHSVSLLINFLYQLPNQQCPDQLHSPVHPGGIGCVYCSTTADISPQHSTEVQNVWIYISTPLHVFTAKQLAKQKEYINISSYPCLLSCNTLSPYFLSTAGTVGTPAPSLDDVLYTITKAWESPRCLASDRWAADVAQ